jgi:hypothetical protein
VDDEDIRSSGLVQVNDVYTVHFLGLATTAV